MDFVTESHSSVLQAREEYCWSAVLMVGMEDSHAIRLEKQGLGTANLEELWSEANLVNMETSSYLCCVCGFEDTEDSEELVPCPCEGSSAVVHPSCTRASKAQSGIPRQCLICGSKTGPMSGNSKQLEEGRKQDIKIHSVGSRGSAKSIQDSNKGVKRSWGSANGSVKLESIPESGCQNLDKKADTLRAPPTEVKEVESEKSGVALLGRRFTDVSSVVPIKKRKIQITELLRSPSPPPRSPSPQAASPPPYQRSLSPVTTSPSQEALHPETTSATSPTSLVRRSVSPCSSPEPESLQPSATSPGAKVKLGMTLESETGEVDKKVCFTSKDSDIGQASKGESESHALDKDITDEAAALESLGGNVSKVDLSSLRDDRLHWDLNTDMEAWDTLGQETTDGKVGVQKFRESHSVLRSEESHVKKRVSQRYGCEGMLVKAQDDRGPQVGDQDIPSKKETEANAKKTLLQGPSDVNHENCDSSEDGALSDDGESAEGKLDKSGRPTHQDNAGDGFYTASKAEGLAQLLEEPEIEEGAEYEIQGQPDDASEANLGKQDRALDAKFEGCEKLLEEADECSAGELQDRHETKDIEVLDGHSEKLVGKSIMKCDSWYDLQEEAEAEEYIDYGIEDHQYEGPEGYTMESKLEKQSKPASEAWDTLPGEVEAEEHLDYGDSDCRDVDDAGFEIDEFNAGNYDGSKLVSWEGEALSDACVKSNLDEDFKPSDRNSEPQGSNLDRRGRNRPTGWDKLPDGFESAEEALKAAKEHSSRRGRGGSWAGSGGRGYVTSTQGPPLSSTTRFGSGRGLARDGFTSSRSDNFLGDRRHDELLRGRASFSHGRGLDDGMDTGRGGRNDIRRPTGFHGRGRASGWIDTQTSSWGPGRHRSSPGYGSQGPQSTVSVSGARVESSGFVVGPDCTVTKAGSVMAPGRGGLRSMIGSRGGRGPPINTGRGPPMNSGRGPDMESGGNFGKRIIMGTDRGMLGSSPNSSIAGRFSGPGRGQIDRYRGAPYGGGFDLRRSESPRRSTHHADHSNSNSLAPSLRSESRMVRSRTPPSSHYNSSARSPPSSSKWSHDRRETDNFRDRDFRRPVSRSRLPSIRTSPHVVHGSSLMDERDRQVLAGSRHSPSARGGLSSSINAQSGSLECRRSKRDEDDDMRRGGSHLKDGDHGRFSPRDADRERDNRGNAFRRDRHRDDDRRQDSYRQSGKDGRSSSGHKHGSSRDGDDDVAPRRRRPS